MTSDEEYGQLSYRQTEWDLAIAEIVQPRRFTERE